MQWNKHSELKGRHARFSPSQPSCFNYSDEQIVMRYHNDYRTRLGTEMHAFAASQIELGIKHTSIRNLRNMLVTYIFSKYEQLENSDPADGLHLRYAELCAQLRLRKPRGLPQTYDIACRNKLQFT